MEGIIAALIGAILFGIAVSIQKYALNNMKRFSLAGMIGNIIWLSSLLVLGAGTLSYIFALRASPISVVQPITALTVIIPVIIGVFFFNEYLEVRKWVALVTIIVGILFVVLF